MAKIYPKAYVVTGNDYEATDVIAVLLSPGPVNFRKLQAKWEYENGPVQVAQEQGVVDNGRQGSKTCENLRKFADWLVKEHGFEKARWQEVGLWVGYHSPKSINEKE